MIYMHTICILIVLGRVGLSNYVEKIVRGKVACNMPLKKSNI